jgi:hypothetical protein
MLGKPSLNPEAPAGCSIGGPKALSQVIRRFMATERQIAANRTNSTMSPGPKNTNRTRFNATKHNLLAAGITELDVAEGFDQILTELNREMRPVGVLEKHRVRCIALDIVRQRRAQRLEAEFINARLNPPTYERDLENPLQSLIGQMVEPGEPEKLNVENAEKLVLIFQRYENSFANSILRNERALERSQRIRKGEPVPAPKAIEISVHHSAGDSSHASVTSLERIVDTGETTSHSASGAGGSDALAFGVENQNPRVREGLSDLTTSTSGSLESKPSSKDLWRSSDPKPLWWP